MDNIGIGIDGFNYGPFPKPEDLGIRLSQWIFLPAVEALGFTQDELVAILADYLKLLEGSLEGAIENVRQLFVSRFHDSITKMAELVPENENIQEATANGTVTHICKKSEEQRVTEVLALFTALAGYLACVEREGPDRANTYSFLVHETLSLELPAYVLRLPELLAALQHENPTAFTGRLKQYPSCAMVMLGIFEGGRSKKAVDRPEECSKCSFLASATAEGRRMIMECSKCSYRPRLPWGWNKSIVAGRIPKLGEGDAPDLHDAGCYLEALTTSLLVGREDFITKGINLSVAQEEGLAIMDCRYAELGGEQGIAESLACNHLDKRRQAIVEAPFTEGDAFCKTEEALNTLKSMIAKFKEESTIELKNAEAFRKLGHPASLDRKIEDEDGEVVTLADMIAGSRDLEEAMPQLAKWVESLEVEDRGLFIEHFMSGKSLDEVAIERGWNYDRVQKRAYRLEKQFEEILTKMSD